MVSRSVRNFPESGQPRWFFPGDIAPRQQKPLRPVNHRSCANARCPRTRAEGTREKNFAGSANSITVFSLKGDGRTGRLQRRFGQINRIRTGVASGKKRASQPQRCLLAVRAVLLLRAPTQIPRSAFRSCFSSSTRWAPLFPVRKSMGASKPQYATRRSTEYAKAERKTSTVAVDFSTS